MKLGCPAGGFQTDSTRKSDHYWLWSDAAVLLSDSGRRLPFQATYLEFH